VPWSAANVTDEVPPGAAALVGPAVDPPGVGNGWTLVGRPAVLVAADEPTVEPTAPDLLGGAVPVGGRPAGDPDGPALGIPEWEGTDGGVTDGALGVPDGALGVPDGALGVPDGALGVPDGVLGTRDGVLGAPEGALTGGLGKDGFGTEGVLTGGVATGGLETDGVVTAGVGTEGVFTAGVRTDGVVADGVFTDGVVIEGAVNAQESEDTSPRISRATIPSDTREAEALRRVPSNRVILSSAGPYSEEVRASAPKGGR
jgi:hypothetical protein